MKTIAALALELQKAGVTLFRDGDGIRYRASMARPDDAVLQELSQRRDELFLYFRARDCLDVLPPQHSERLFLPSITQEMWWHWIDPDTSLTLSLIEFIKDRGTASIVTAICGLVAQHDTLRSRFSEENGILRIMFNTADGFEVETEVLPPSAAVESLKILIDAFVARPLTASAAWLIRAKVFSVPDRGHVAVIIANHMVVDGTSIALLRAELRQCLGKAKPPPPRGQALSYADFAAWQRACLVQSGGALAEYWSAWARNQPEILSPMGKVPMRWRSGRKVRRTFTIPPFAQGAVAGFALENSTFPFLVYLTMLALSVARWSGRSKFPLRSICDCRTVPAFSSTVGLMTGADAINIALNPSHSFMESLREIEAEYHAASRLRLPNIYAFPPFAIGPDEDDQQHNIAVVMNYRKTASHAGETFPSHGTWPPPEGAPRRDVWRHPVSPVCLELTQVGGMATAAFLMHEDVLSAPEQESLIQAFFAIFEETVLQGNEMAKEPALT